MMSAETKKENTNATPTSVEVRLPASTSNLGSGFDCLSWSNCCCDALISLSRLRVSICSWRCCSFTFCSCRAVVCSFKISSTGSAAAKTGKAKTIMTERQSALQVDFVTISTVLSKQTNAPMATSRNRPISRRPNFPVWAVLLGVASSSRALFSNPWRRRAKECR